MIKDIFRKLNPFRGKPLKKYTNPIYDDERLENPEVWAKKHPREAAKIDELVNLYLEVDKKMKGQKDE